MLEYFDVKIDAKIFTEFEYGEDGLVWYMVNSWKLRTWLNKMSFFEFVFIERVNKIFFTDHITILHCVAFLSLLFERRIEVYLY